MRKKIKMCHGDYKVVKEVERHIISGREPNNHRRLHGKPLRRRQKFRFLMLKIKKREQKEKGKCNMKKTFEFEETVKYNHSIEIEVDNENEYEQFVKVVGENIYIKKMI